VQPIMTLLVGSLVFQELPTPGQLLGALVLFVGVVVAARR
jgi:drug/metabolite transporter (DMT)-like permease